MLSAALIAALAVGAAPLTNAKKDNACINAATLDAASSTCDINVDGNFAKVDLFFVHGNSAATAITVTPWCSNDAGTTFFRYSSLSITAGTATVSQLAYSVAVSGDLNWMLEFDVRGCDIFRAVVTDTGGGASDTLTVDSVKIVGE